MTQYKKIVLVRSLSENVLVFLLQYTGMMLLGPVSFAFGTAVAFIFMRGITVVPGIWLGSFASYFFLSHHALLSATALTLSVLLLLIFHYRFIGPTLLVHEKSQFITSFFAILLFSSLSGFDSFSSLFANFLGVLIVARALLIWDCYFPELNEFKKMSVPQLLLDWRSATLLLFLVAFIINLICYLSPSHFKGMDVFVIQFMLLFVSFLTLIPYFFNLEMG